MQLEQNLEMYQPMASQERQQTYFVVGDLEGLSASALYTGKLPPMGPGGFGVDSSGKSSKDLLDLPMFGSVKIETPKEGIVLSEGLTIKKVGGNSLILNQDFGLLRDLYTLHPDGSGSKREIVLTKKSKLVDKKSW